ncbi:hypothetical protein HDU87_005410 [Geranomyces variabilis]|uniref:Protein YAE1 n=1 Tax=Geranomyces variabilis TaxID=109894 RepID=A0AAD5XR77_9FUNG|nr:hypothetical protein HDU87_005410 [Geranomyces variabilis]
MDSDDDWADDSGLTDAQYDKLVAERNWNRLQDEHGVAGYKDGITEGKKASLQDGFDAGYTNGVEAGLALGRLRGLLSTMVQIQPSRSTGDSSLADRLSTILSELEATSVEHVFTLAYFRATEATSTAPATATACTSRAEESLCGAGGGSYCKAKGHEEAEHMHSSGAESAQHPRAVVAGFRKRIVEIGAELGWDMSHID